MFLRSVLSPDGQRLSGLATRAGTLLPGLLLAVGIVSTPAFAQPGADDYRDEIRLKGWEFDPLERIPTHPELPTISAYQPGVRGSYLVQFERPISERERKALQEAGASIKGYVPHRTLEVVMSEEQREAVESLPGVRWVGLHQPAFKLSRGFLQTLLTWATGEPGTRRRLQVSLFPGEGDVGRQALKALGARVLKTDSGRSFEIVEVEVPAGALKALTRIPQVRFIEPVYERRPLATPLLKGRARKIGSCPVELSTPCRSPISEVTLLTAEESHQARSG